MNGKEDAIEVEYTLKGVSTKFKKALRRIPNLKEIDLDCWFEEFDEVQQHINWTPEEVKIILKSLINDPNFPKNELCGDLVSCRKKLEEFIYPNSESLIFLNQLDSIKQVNFLLFDSYVHEIESRLKRYAICVGLSDKEIQRKRNECILRGLSSITKYEVAKINLLTQSR